MQRFKFDMRAWVQWAALAAATSFFAADAIAAKMAGDPAATCSDLIRPTDNAVRIDSASMAGYTDGMNSSSTLTKPSPSQVTQRPLATLNENRPAS